MDSEVFSQIQRNTYLKINLDNVTHNLKILRSFISEKTGKSLHYVTCTYNIYDKNRMSSECSLSSCPTCKISTTKSTIGYKCNKKKFYELYKNLTHTYFHTNFNFKAKGQ